jgi:hypothetical protein
MCDSDWTGGDCTKRIYALTDYANRVWNIKGAQYTYLAFEETLYYNEGFELTLTSNNQPMSIYLKQGSIYQTNNLGQRYNEPNEFKYDIAFKNHTKVVITSDMLQSMPKFSLMVIINGIDIYNNKTLETSFNVQFRIKNNQQASASSPSIKLWQVLIVLGIAGFLLHSKKKKQTIQREPLVVPTGTSTSINSD